MRLSDSYGDFQTPPALAADVWKVVDLSGVDVIVEPTVGLGGFLSAAPQAATQSPWIAWDINTSYVDASRQVLKDRGIGGAVETQDVFRLEPGDVPFPVADRTVLAIGNPPWVTNAAQAQATRQNLPKKWNRFGLSGLDAMTGRANFDIAEAVILSVVAAMAEAKELRLAFLVKRSVAMKMARDLLGAPGVSHATFARIDARRWFGASVEAGLFCLRIRPKGDESSTRIDLRDELGGPLTATAGYSGQAFAEDLAEYSVVAGVEASRNAGLVWRQGLKHDVARILELKPVPTGLLNGYGDVVDIEDDVLCPFYKSSDIANGRGPSRRFPLYQYDLSGPAKDLKERWPRLGQYLASHRDKFLARRSRIYRDKPDFMLYGVGPYVNAPYKVAISGFYKRSEFRILEPSSTGAPPLVDDTCYLLPFETLEDAEAMSEYLNSASVQAFLKSVVDLTAKRPYTKAILSRIRDPNASANPAPDSQIVLI